MSRSGYNDGDDTWSWIRWRGAVASAIRGRRGQAFLKEMLDALNALPEKRLIQHELEDPYDGAVCALGAVGRKRQVSMEEIDPEDSDEVAALFKIPRALACEVMWLNDASLYKETPERRWARIRYWIIAHLKSEVT